MTRSHRGMFRTAALVALVAPALAACSVSDQTMGVRGDNPKGAMFNHYVAIGTSIGAGFQSGGINDSTQRQSYAYLLAQSMGFHPGLDWFYPSLAMPGCPAPIVNPLTNPATRVNNANNPKGCLLRTPGSTAPYENNVSIPGIRLAQVWNIDTIPFGATDTLNLSQFITGGASPIAMAAAQHATFITLEAFANDVLGAGTHQDTTLMTSMSSFNTYLTAIADSIDHMGAKAAVINLPSIVPFFSQGVMFWCLNNGLCPGVSATPPFNSPNFSVGASCAPGALGGVGDSMVVGFIATGTIAGVLAAGGAAHLACDTGYATVTTLAGTSPVGPVANKFVFRAFETRIAEMNAALAALATARGYALVDFHGMVDAAVVAGQVPPFPNLANPTNVFGPLFTQDGVHPSALAHKLIADSLVGAINHTYGSQLQKP